MDTQWYVIPFMDNKKLGQILFDRAKELGYRVRTDYNPSTYYCISLHIRDKEVWLDNQSNAKEAFETGKTYRNTGVVINVSDFLLTNKYKPTKSPIEVVLNESYTAKITADSVVVGCQSFPSSKIHELAKALELYING
jgi:hypothetical protein